MTKAKLSTLLQTALLSLQLVVVVSDDDATATFKTIFESNNNLDINGVILAIGALLVGVLLLVTGYRFWQTTVYTLGFLGGGVVVAAIFESLFEHEAWVLTASWAAFVVAGIIVGYLCVYLYFVGIFMTGAVAGAVLGILLNTSIGYKFAPSHPAATLVVLAAVFAIFGGAMTLWLHKPALIAAIGLVGSFLMFWGIGHFVGNYPTFNDLGRFQTYSPNGDLEYSIPDAWWGYLIGTLALCVFSVVLQFWFTGKDVEYHTFYRQYRNPASAPYDIRTPAQYTNLGTPNVQDQRQYYEQQRYPTSNQVLWEDLQNQRPRNQNSSQTPNYVDTLLTPPQHEQREHDYQISDIVPTTTRPQEFSQFRAQTAPPSARSTSHIV